MSKYEHIFFDLDHTLWDFETNSAKALLQIFEAEQLLNRGIATFESFHHRYMPINDRYWARYHNGLVNKEQVRVHRFYDTLRELGIDDMALALRMADSYVELSPKMTALFPQAVEVLQYLQTKYKMHLITNGFAEVQWIKIEHSGLKPFFEHIIISEEVGTQKPDKKIFNLAVERACTQIDKCIMIGDNFNTDIIGAKSAGMDQVFFNPRRKRKPEEVTYEVFSLPELKNFL
ncbi:MAG: YjjG family noncanonical pyrimidine nucleotidase [Chitinophagales bacterium]